MLGRRRPPQGSDVADWAEGLDLPVGGETILFVDCEAAFYRTSYTRATAQLLQRPGVEFGLMREQWCCGGPAAEMGYVEQARAFAEHNVADWRAVGAKRIIAVDPHDYIALHRGLPQPTSATDYDFEIVLVIDLVAELIRHGKLKLEQADQRTVTYHDPCRLNKRKGVHKAPRTSCSHAGADLHGRRPRHPVVVLLRGRRRPADREARDHRGDPPPGWRAPRNSTWTCWSVRASGRSGRCRLRATQVGIEVVDIIELVAESAGIEIGGRRGASDWRGHDDQRAVRTLDDAVVDDLEAIIERAGRVLTKSSSRVNRTRVPAPFPVHRWARVHARRRGAAAHRRAGVGDREAGQPARSRSCPGPAGPG